MQWVELSAQQRARRRFAVIGAAVIVASLAGLLVGWSEAQSKDLTPAEVVAAGGAALDRVLAMVDDCEWRLRRAEAEGKDTSMLPDPDELRRRLGIPARTRR